jgi:hypothetical protein
LLLTALVYPGIGELAQRRWVAGTAVIVAFTVSAGWFLVQAGRATAAYYQMAFDFNAAPECVAVRPRDIVMPFVVALGVYVAAVVDTAIADLRARHGAT